MRCALVRQAVKSIAEHLSSSSSSSSTASESISIHAWIRTVRRQKTLSFVSLNDGSSHQGIQAVIPSSILDQHEEKVKSALTSGASVVFRGKLQDKKAGKGVHQGVKELQVESFDVLGECDGATYPMQAKDHSLPFLRRNAHLRGRTSLISSMLRLRSSLTTSCYSYFDSQKFLNVTMPLTTSSDCEGAGEVFSLYHGSTVKGKEKPFYDRPTYLSVSGQLHQEAMVVGGGLNRIWHLAPAFRAEKSDTNRHLNEFWMCEAELAFTEHLEDVMQVVEGLVKHLATSLYSQETMQKEMQDVLPEGYTTIKGLDRNKDQPWKRLRYAEAMTLLQDAVRDKKTVFQHPVDYSSGLKSEHERWLADQFGPTFVTDYPACQKPFYMRVNSSSAPDDHTVACFDLLVPRIGELAGGSLREERLDPLLRTMKERNMNIEEYDWYIDLRRYGSVKHGGFGLGWERLISWFTGIENVRECIAFPRGSEGSRY